MPSTILLTTLILALSACVASAQTPVTLAPCSPQTPVTAETYRDVVWYPDSLPRPIDPGGGFPLKYAPNMEKGSPESATVSYVVDTTGQLRRESVIVLHASNPELKGAVCQMILEMTFHPAVKEGRLVPAGAVETVSFK